MEDLTHGKLHGLKVKIPDNFIPHFSYFLIGEYSRMFTKEEITEYYNYEIETKRDLLLDLLNKTVKVCHRSQSMITKLANNLGVDSGSFTGELDSAPDLEQETYHANAKYKDSIKGWRKNAIIRI